MVSITMACLHVALSVTAAVENFGPGGALNAVKPGEALMEVQSLHSWLISQSD
jgi:hypothetical protein